MKDEETPVERVKPGGFKRAAPAQPVQDEPDEPAKAAKNVSKPRNTRS